MTQSWTEVWYFREALYNSIATWFLEGVTADRKDLVTQQYWHQFPVGSANSHIQSGLEHLIETTGILEKQDADQAIEQVMTEYTTLFLGPGIPKAPIVESFYLEDQLFFGPSTVAMRQLLSKYGLESKMKDRHPEDHLGIELLFLSYQSQAFTTLDEKECVNLAQEQIAFITDHLLTWIPNLHSKTVEHGDVGFYSGIVELLWGILLWDTELLQEYSDSHEHITR
ncbi:TorD/DmsD family molecular chaperone [Lentibacillus cibarius]|uniref:Molecular chaperone TorD family protein n=1 Tax=Lentibacillus cibarius TaxID=2583219 RepID=A0A5S3QK75_9BACI|nr:molecular chaperone TorD family protein [Lentibacillus cibarius]TMN22228.1 molecular chaperone TorD family protein [Lentibacillus cibarius]